MSTIAIYTLLAVVGVLALTGGLVAIWRLIPRHSPSAQALAALERVGVLETIFTGFADQFELSVNRNSQKVRRLRKALAQERGEEEEEDVHTVAAAPSPQLVETKDELRRRVNAGG